MILAGGVAFASQHDFEPSGSVEVSLTTLSAFTFDQDKGTLADIPPPLQALDGHQVEVDGYMIPIDQSEQMTTFALVAKFPAERMSPMIQEVIVVHAAKEQNISYTSERIRVRGVLHVRVQTDDGYIVNIYDLNADHVTFSPIP